MINLLDHFTKYTFVHVYSYKNQKLLVVKRRHTELKKISTEGC